MNNFNQKAHNSSQSKALKGGTKVETIRLLMSEGKKSISLGKSLNYCGS